jgi:hypothetical protein
LYSRTYFSSLFSSKLCRMTGLSALLVVWCEKELHLSAEQLPKLIMMHSSAHECCSFEGWRHFIHYRHGTGDIRSKPHSTGGSYVPPEHSCLSVTSPLQNTWHETTEKGIQALKAFLNPRFSGPVNENVCGGVPQIKQPNVRTEIGDEGLLP